MSSYLGIIKLCKVGPQAPDVIYFSYNKIYIPYTECIMRKK